MMAEFGYFSLIMAATIASIEIAISLWGEWHRQPQWLQLNPYLTNLQTLFVGLSFSTLLYSFATNDFSLQYVAAHSNSQLPIFFKLAASWGGHEGSMLFWLTALCLWASVFCFFSRKIDRLFAHRTQTVLAVISLGFMLFILLTSSPFERQFPPPPEGRDLNPMLQDIGLIFHPPLLYLGYVGFGVVFSMAVAMLIGGIFKAEVARWLRPWTLISWGFLTAGIMVGAWWAYYELGWGGWWFWDPVENASLMPWLLGSALLHSLIASEQRNVLNYWTILLAIFAFALSLLGTFIVRSGVMTSVHAFAVDPDRGMALLLLFFSLCFIALSLFALKLKIQHHPTHFNLLSKENAFLLINGILCIAMCVVLIGTFYPMLFSAMNWGAISVGAPYFNGLFTPLALCLLPPMALAIQLQWKQIKIKPLVWRFAWLPVAIGLSFALIALTLQRVPSHSPQWLPIVFVSLAIWLILTHLPYRPFHWKIRPLAMRLAHIGFATSLIGAVMSSYYGDEIGVKLRPNEQASLAGFHFVFHRYQDKIGENYTAEVAQFQIISPNGKPLAEVAPERRYYDIRTMTMSEVGLYHHGLDDLYVVIGDKFGNYQYAFRLHYKPFVRLLWLGSMLMIIASLMAVFAFRQPKNPEY